MHSLVMALTFMKGSPKERIIRLLSLTKDHALSLGLYVGLYKLLVLIFEKITLKTTKIHNFLAGVVAGYIMYKDGSNPVNQQIIMYLLSRNLIGGAKNLQARGVIPQIKFFPILAALSWGFVMYLFEDNRSTLQGSLASSMQFIYNESRQISGWTDFVPIYIPEAIKNTLENAFLTSSQSHSSV